MRLFPFPTPFMEILRSRQMDVTIALYAAIAFAFVCDGGYKAAWISLLVPFLAVAALSTRSPTARFGAVLGLAVVMGLLVLTNYYIVANHGFMLLWFGLGLALACACEAPKDEAVLRRNATLLLALLMLIALIQKLRSPYYMDGDLLGGLLVEGEIYANIIGWVMPDWPGLLQDYRAAFAEVAASVDPTSAAIAVPVAISALAWRMTLGSLVAQAVLEVMILFRARVGMLLHVAILAFVVVVYSTRNENVFLSVNCVLGYAMTDEKTAAVRPWYVLAVVYLLSTILIGLRPWIIS